MHIYISHVYIYIYTYIISHIYIYMHTPHDAITNKSNDNNKEYQKLTLIPKKQ